MMFGWNGRPPEGLATTKTIRHQRVRLPSIHVWAWVVGPGLNFGMRGAWAFGPRFELNLGLVESAAVDKKSNTNLLPRLLAPEETEDGVGSNPKGKELAFS
ncbi:hypothetical protein RchiOBHm_Chr3g0485261 [Rosa chinensis]|uniref:Uncharacterized protein n=1 Tax=Rosa chinensis TaxID=74649 RepID=A0A2P6REX6_ROSCH|nr:hypothetical protein RchiOBHm_Chr3g0485261 [Rosa chinensis]